MDEVIKKTTKNKSKSHFHKRISKEMSKHLEKPTWNLQQKLALTARILAHQDHGSGLAGQVTARGKKTGTMWTGRFGLGLEELRASDFLLVDQDLNVLEGEGMVNPANRFHLWIYLKRKDVKSIVHTHSPYASALAMIGVPLIPSHMDTAMFYNDCAFLEHWPGPPIGDDEGELIATALGKNRAILLAHHGQLSAGGSVEEASVLAYNFEVAARLQLLAMAAGEIKPLDPSCAEDAHDYRLKPEVLNATFLYQARVRLRQGEKDCLD
jgi:L-fuculose-phosphate aldolase